MRMLASVYGACDCSVCYARYKALPERLAAPGTARMKDNRGPCVAQTGNPGEGKDQENDQAEDGRMT